MFLTSSICQGLVCPGLLQLLPPIHWYSSKQVCKCLPLSKRIEKNTFGHYLQRTRNFRTMKAGDVRRIVPRDRASLLGSTRDLPSSCRYPEASMITALLRTSHKHNAIKNLLGSSSQLLKHIHTCIFKVFGNLSQYASYSKLINTLRN